MRTRRIGSIRVGALIAWSVASLACSQGSGGSGNSASSEHDGSAASAASSSPSGASGSTGSVATSTASSSSSRVGDAGVARDDGGGDAATPRDAAAPTDGSALAFDDAGCVEATIDFHVVAKPGNKFRYCLGAGECLGGSWLTLAVVDGGYVPSPALVGIPDLACGYGYESCNGCQDMGCTDTCSSPETLDDAGATATWGGKYFQGGMCGAAMNACAQTLCVAPGAYTVTFCGAAEPADASSAGQGCTGSDTPTCVVVPFTWPPPSGHAVVEGAIGDVE